MVVVGGVHASGAHLTLPTRLVLVLAGKHSLDRRRTRFELFTTPATHHPMAARVVNHTNRNCRMAMMIVMLWPSLLLLLFRRLHGGTAHARGYAVLALRLEARTRGEVHASREADCRHES